MTKDSALRMALEALNLVQIRSEDGEDLTPKKAREAITAIKEALAQPEQRNASEHLEPVAYMWPTKDSFVLAEDVGLIPNWTDYYTVPLYTTPPQRKPLTDEQREVIAKGWRGRNWTLGDVIDAVESAHGIKD